MQATVEYNMTLSPVVIANAGIPTLVKEMDRVSDLLQKYGHRWDEDPSMRMYSWVNTFEHIRYEREDAYDAWLDSHGWLNDGWGARTAYDCMA